MKGVVAIVPAAGRSSRFGGPNKLLQAWNGGTVVGAVAHTLLDSGIEVIVVTGRDAEDVSRAVAPARSVFNPNFANGLSSTIAAGVAAAGVLNGYLIALGDMPGVRREVVLALLDALDPESIVVPSYAADPERIGHPVLFGGRYREALMNLRGDQGARSILEANENRVLRLRVAGGLADVDRPGDLRD